MKKKILAAVAVSVLWGWGQAQAEVSLFDYKQGSSDSEEAYVIGAFDLSKGRNDGQSSYNLDLNAFYDRLFSTPARDFSYGGEIIGNVNRGSAKDAERSSTYQASIDGNIDSYFVPGSSGAFWYGGGRIEARDKLENLDNFDTDNVETTATIGAGIGRVTDVTPMAYTIRVMDELYKRRIINAKPAVGVYQEIAQIVAKEYIYKRRYGANDYVMYWVSDIEKALRNSGSLANGLGAQGAIKVRDVLMRENTFKRRIGWKVRAGLGYAFTAFDGDPNPKLEVQGEYHMPLNNRTQFSNVATFSTKINDGDDSYSATNDMSLSYEVADNIDWLNSWDIDYRHNGKADTNGTIHTLASTFSYEINNVLSFETTASLVNEDGSSDDGTDRRLTMGLKYRLR